MLPARFLATATAAPTETTAAVTAAAAAAAEAARAGFLRTGFVHRQLTATELLAVAGVNGRLRFFLRRHALASVAVVDEYRGKNLPDGRRSVAVRLVFRAADRTLTDADVEQAMGRLRTSLERELDVTVRTS